MTYPKPTLPSKGKNPPTSKPSPSKPASKNRIQTLTTTHHHRTHQNPRPTSHLPKTHPPHHQDALRHPNPPPSPRLQHLHHHTPRRQTRRRRTRRPHRKPKTSRSNSTPDPTTRQRRIDEIWGPAPASSPSETGDANEEPSAPKPPRNESQAAATELRTLTEQLLNALLEAATEGYESAGGYVTLARDSAAARFLVRSKVAQYHFRDARRLTLVDFGGDKRDNTKQVFEASKTSNASKVIGNEEEETKNITQKEKLNKVSLLINPQWLKYQHHPNIHSIR
ncbi:hypothetical protein EYC80_001310 [Monilinia laxa]|uniref:Uncharacterized protein n=1 Tax=Monilinia laxa TaxID=61186 RepID=A0A5N6K8X2_MONLA|nr:hypothetical protein EYC80_001310 [Monilinia laxa]